MSIINISSFIPLLLFQCYSHLTDEEIETYGDNLPWKMVGSGAHLLNLCIIQDPVLDVYTVAVQTRVIPKRQ